MYIIETPRLGLRLWKDSDAPALFALTNNSETMHYIGPYWPMDQVMSYMHDMNALFATHKTTYFAVEEKESGSFIGFIGVKPTPWNAPFTPSFDIGWRLLPDYWGKGYATEGALASLTYVFETCGITEIVSYTKVINSKSQRVMQKIGMTRDVSADFIHPKSSDLHVLYRLKKSF